MKMTIDDFLDAIQGRASRQNSSAVAAEIENPGSALHGHLRDVETWAKAHPTMAPHEEMKPLLPQGDIRDKTRSRFAHSRRMASEMASRPEAAIIDDYLRCLGKTASKEAIARVALSLINPASELSQLLDGVSDTQPAALPTTFASDHPADELLEEPEVGSCEVSGTPISDEQD